MVSKQQSVNVWWVNQGGTYSDESAGAYFWAPLKGKVATPPHHWRRMNDVRRGDIVLHYVQGYVKANLVEATYYELNAPVPREIPARLNTLPEAGGPFTSAGSVQQGYLFAFGAEALRELVNVTDTDWPEWVTKFVADGKRPETIADHPVLQKFLDEILNLNVASVDGRRKLYKPLLLLAAMRTVLDGESIRFGTPLLDYYEQFCEAVNADASTPYQPYFYLTNDGLWQLFNDDGRPFIAHGRPGRSELDGTYAQFPGGRQQYLLDPTWRPLIFGALRTHFQRGEWKALSERWPELMIATAVPGTQLVTPSPTPAQIRERFASLVDEFAKALIDNNLRFGQAHDDFVRIFVASLATKPFIILTGLSGSGKTQIGQQFGHWVGEEQLLAVPVRPDWTGSDALFGYEDALRPVSEDGIKCCKNERGMGSCTACLCSLSWPCCCPSPAATTPNRWEGKYTSSCKQYRLRQRDEREVSVTGIVLPRAEAHRVAEGTGAQAEMSDRRI